MPDLAPTTYDDSYPIDHLLSNSKRGGSREFRRSKEIPIGITVGCPRYAPYRSCFIPPPHHLKSV
jgi:hypothetical protein